jgi:type VI secretion system protein ImpH
MADRKPLNQQLFDEPYRFDFFQAVRLLERIYPEMDALAESPVPTNEVVRIRSNPSLKFPPSQIHKLEEVVDEETGETRIEMTVNFMGMVGIAGVLPIHYSELINERRRYSDTAMGDFLDMFSHRIVSLFFKAWEKYRFPIQYERGEDDFTSFMFDWVGLGTKGLRGRMGLDDERLLPYSGLIQQKPHSASALEQLLSDYYGVPAVVKQFFGQWLELDDESITKLSVANSVLGVDALVGTRVWDQQSKFRLVLGAMSFVQFQNFLPNGNAHEPLKAIIRFMTGLELDFDLQLVLQSKQVPSCILTTRAKRRPRLGWTSWLKSKPFESDDDQVVLQVAEVFA